MTRWRFRNKRGPILGIVLPTAVSIGILAVVINDGGQLVAAQVRAESVARAAAAAGADVWYRTHRADLARNYALSAAQLKDPTTRVVSVSVDERTAQVTVVTGKAAP